jgi:hypothetical protein
MEVFGVLNRKLEKKKLCVEEVKPNDVIPALDHYTDRAQQEAECRTEEDSQRTARIAPHQASAYWLNEQQLDKVIGIESTEPSISLDSATNQVQVPEVLVDCPLLDPINHLAELPIEKEVRVLDAKARFLSLCKDDDKDKQHSDNINTKELALVHVDYRKIQEAKDKFLSLCRSVNDNKKTAERPDNSSMNRTIAVKETVAKWRYIVNYSSPPKLKAEQRCE